VVRQQFQPEKKLIVPQFIIYQTGSFWAPGMRKESLFQAKCMGKGSLYPSTGMRKRSLFQAKCMGKGSLYPSTGMRNGSLFQAKCMKKGSLDPSTDIRKGSLFQAKCMGKGSLYPSTDMRNGYLLGLWVYKRVICKILLYERGAFLGKGSEKSAKYQNLVCERVAIFQNLVYTISEKHCHSQSEKM